MLDLTGKRAVITGGSSGIGLAVARRFMERGASLVVLDLDSEKAERAAGSPGADASMLQAIDCDVSSETSVSAAFGRIAGPIDILVNSAGIAHVGNLETTLPQDMDRLYAVNVRGTYLCMRAALQPMLAQGKGIILNMSSIAATSGLSDRLAYSMSKGAVLAMTLSVARDYVAQGIRCNCISPARVHTPFVDGFLARNYPGKEAEKMADLARSQPIGRMGTPDEIATLVLYLCSEEASFITGADYLIDGGFTNLR